MSEKILIMKINTDLFKEFCFQFRGSYANLLNPERTNRYLTVLPEQPLSDFTLPIKHYEITPNNGSGNILI